MVNAVLNRLGFPDFHKNHALEIVGVRAGANNGNVKLIDWLLWVLNNVVGVQANGDLFTQGATFDGTLGKIGVAVTLLIACQQIEVTLLWLNSAHGGR
jgi:hypothetical protein